MILNNEKKLNPTTKTAGVEQEFQKIAAKEASSVLQELGCTTNGISDEEREERLAKYGYNDLSAMQKSWRILFFISQFYRCFYYCSACFSYLLPLLWKGIFCPESLSWYWPV